jgi:hypothetical protein
MKVWKRGHRGSDPSNFDKLCNLVAKSRLVSYWQTFLTCSLLSVLSRLQFASPCRKSIRKKWWKNMTNASNTRRSPLTVGSSMTVEAKKHTDGEIDALFSLTLWMRDMVPLTIVDCLFLKVCSVQWVLDSTEAMPLRWSSSSSSSGLTPRVSRMHLNYESMQDDLRETWESVNDFNAQIQAFMAVRNKNTFIAFLTFSDIYVCFTLFALQAMVQRIPDAAGIPVPTW